MNSSTPRPLASYRSRWTKQIRQITVLLVSAPSRCVCMCVCVRVPMRACQCICKYIHTCTCACIHMYMHMHLCMCMYMYIYIDIGASARIQRGCGEDDQKPHRVVKASRPVSAVSPSQLRHNHASERGDDDHVFLLFLQKQKIALRHIPFGYFPPRNKEAHVMMLPP